MCVSVIAVLVPVLWLAVLTIWCEYAAALFVALFQVSCDEGFCGGRLTIDAPELNPLWNPVGGFAFERGRDCGGGFRGGGFRGGGFRDGR